jgi:3-hydroxybutyrate dehydrogenase
VVKNIMLKDTVDGAFTTVEDFAEATLFFGAFEAAFKSNVTDRPVGHSWFMQWHHVRSARAEHFAGLNSGVIT